MRSNRLPEPPPTPVWFKAWFAVCALVGLAFLGLIVWAIVEIVEKVTRG
jgi:hypothetical protein